MLITNFMLWSSQHVGHRPFISRHFNSLQCESRCFRCDQRRLCHDDPTQQMLRIWRRWRGAWFIVLSDTPLGCAAPHKAQASLIYPAEQKLVFKWLAGGRMQSKNGLQFPFLLPIFFPPSIFFLSIFVSSGMCHYCPYIRRRVSSLICLYSLVPPCFPLAVFSCSRFFHFFFLLSCCCHFTSILSDNSPRKNARVFFFF